MKYLLVLLATFTCSSIAFAQTNEREAIKLCADMIIQKQAQVKPAQTNITTKQANNYCRCIVPKLQKIQTSEENLTQEGLQKIYQGCQNQAGIKLSK